MTQIYFFDSYAIIEILKGNENYRKYSESAIVTTKLNLFEVYYSVLRDFDEKTADNTLLQYYDYVVDFGKEIIKYAALFRLFNKARNLSMADCIGYTLSRRLGIKFLTGDKEFERMVGVEFVK